MTWFGYSLLGLTVCIVVRAMFGLASLGDRRTLYKLWEGEPWEDGGDCEMSPEDERSHLIAVRAIAKANGFPLSDWQPKIGAGGSSLRVTATTPRERPTATSGADKPSPYDWDRAA